MYSDPAQMERLLPAIHRQAQMLEKAYDVIRRADQLGSKMQPLALGGLRTLLRAMNSYYTNRIEGQHSLPVEIEQALRSEYSADTDRASRQHLAANHMATEHALALRWALANAWLTRKVSLC